jgi:hypothetical protein
MPWRKIRSGYAGGPDVLDQGHDDVLGRHPVGECSRDRHAQGFQALVDQGLRGQQVLDFRRADATHSAEGLRAGVFVGDLAVDVQQHMALVVERADGMAVDVLLVKRSGADHGRALFLSCTRTGQIVLTEY